MENQDPIPLAQAAQELIGPYGKPLSVRTLRKWKSKGWASFVIVHWGAKKLLYCTRFELEWLKKHGPRTTRKAQIDYDKLWQIERSKQLGLQ